MSTYHFLTRSYLTLSMIPQYCLLMRFGIFDFMTQDIKMIRFTIFSLAILIIQGCTTFKTGRLESIPSEDTKNMVSTIPSNKLPIVIQYYTTYGLNSDSGAKQTKSVIMDSVSEIIDNPNIKFVDEYKTLPEEYIHLYVIQDVPHDIREGNNNGIQVISTLLNILSFTIIPAIDVDIEDYIKISHIHNNTVQSSQVFIQKHRRYFSLLLVPLSPFFNLDNSLSESIKESIVGYFHNEV